MGREIRRVPPDWQHPKEYTNQLVVGGGDDPSLSDFAHALAFPRYEQREVYKPLYDKAYIEVLWEIAAWEEGTHPDWHDDWTWEDWSGTPDPDMYRPYWAAGQATAYQVYETVSEGTPVSPVFAALPDLVDWLVAQGYSRGAAQEFAETGWAPSMVVRRDASGIQFANDIESYSLRD